jgi:hypothetical protein
MATLVHPTRKQVLDGFYEHLQDWSLTSVTSKELADSKRWALMDVSAALNQAAERGTLARDGAAFRPLAPNKPTQSAEMVQKLPQVVRVRRAKHSQPPHEFPSDPEFRERYERVLFEPGSIIDTLRIEFGAHYDTVRKHAIQVYKRLGIPKPNAMGRRVSKFQAQESQEATSTQESPEIVENLSAAPSETEDCSPPPLSEETNEANEARREDDEYRVFLIARVSELDGKNQTLRQELDEARKTNEGSLEEQTFSWRRLREADDALTEKESEIASLQAEIARLNRCIKIADRNIYSLSHGVQKPTSQVTTGTNGKGITVSFNIPGSDMTVQIGVG